MRSLDVFQVIYACGATAEELWLIDLRKTRHTGANEQNLFVAHLSHLKQRWQTLRRVRVLGDGDCYSCVDMPSPTKMSVVAVRNFGLVPMTRQNVEGVDIDFASLCTVSGVWMKDLPQLVPWLEQRGGVTILQVLDSKWRCNETLVDATRLTEMLMGNNVQCLPETLEVLLSNCLICVKSVTLEENWDGSVPLASRRVKLSGLTVGVLDFRRLQFGMEVFDFEGVVNKPSIQCTARQFSGLEEKPGANLRFTLWEDQEEFGTYHDGKLELAGGLRLLPAFQVALVVVHVSTVGEACEVVDRHGMLNAVGVMVAVEDDEAGNYVFKAFSDGFGSVDWSGGLKSFVVRKKDKIMLAFSISQIEKK